MKGRPKGEGQALKHGGKGTLYDDGVYQTQLKTDRGQGIWKHCLALGADEWEEIVVAGATKVWIVDSLWRRSHHFTVADGEAYGRIERTKNGLRFLMPIHWTKRS